MTPLAAFAITGCLAIGQAEDEVRLRDIAPAFDTVEGASAGTFIALAPAPGVARRFEIAELRRLALRLGLSEPRREICVERPVSPLDPARILAAMQAQLPAARIELLDYSRLLVPGGALEFPVSGLRQAGAAAIWSGAVSYGGRHRLPIWARVDVRVSAARVVAEQDLPAGKAIDSGALRLETRDEFPSGGAFSSRLEEVAGRLPRRFVRAGTAIESAWLETPRAVARGETVEVEVREGGARLRFSAQALASGAVGRTIPVLNPASNKRFIGRVEAAGRVAVGKGTP
jgi:flagella basal body P-ring formation protein FlgA